MAWTEEQVNNARIIATVGKKLGASQRDVQIALMAAIVESGLRNLNYGDRDSVGLFQQRNAWGSFQQRTTPAESARMFFQGGHAGQRGLFDFDNRNEMGLGEAAQAVQVSAYPGRYAEHEAEALQLLGSFGIKGWAKGPAVDIDTSIDPVTAPSSGSIAPSVGSGPSGLNDVGSVDFNTPGVLEVNGLGELTVDDVGLGTTNMGQPGYGTSMGESSTYAVDGYGRTNHVSTGGGGGGGVGSSYNPMSKSYMPSLEDFGIDWSAIPGGGGALPDVKVQGWRKNVISGANKMLGVPYVWGGTSYSGVDCSGLVQLMFKAQGIDLPRLSADQARSGPQIPLNQLTPGDLVAWDNSSRNNGADHIAIYIGNDQIIEAPRPGGHVQISKLYDTGRAWGVSMAKYDPVRASVSSTPSRSGGRSGGGSSRPSGNSSGGGSRHMGGDAGGLAF